MDANLNTQVSIGQTRQTNLQPQQQDKPETQSELTPLLKRDENLTVSNAPVDLEALVAKLNITTANAKETTAKSMLSSTFTTVIAKALERGMISTRNMELLTQAGNYQKQLDSTDATIDTLTTQVSQLKEIVSANEKDVAKQQAQCDSLEAKQSNLNLQIQQSEAKVQILQMEIDSLTARIEAEVDAQKQTNLKNRLANEQKKLETEKADLNELQNKKETIQANLAKAQAALAAAQANLGAVKTTLTDAEGVLGAAIAAKAELKQKIQQTLADITDDSVIRDIADALKINVTDVASIMMDDAAERSEEEEKYLEAHSPVQILQEALTAHYQDILDTIAAKRENLV